MTLPTTIILLLSFSTAAMTQEPEIKFRFPIAGKDRKLIKRSPVYGFDNDPADRMAARCRNYQGRRFPRCYDGHRGTDFMLIGKFRTMDRGSAKVVAAAAGKVTNVVDGNYDRCRTSVWRMGVSCHGHPMKANKVEITHIDGQKTRYLHLKKNSIAVQIGDWVECGQKLGLVGSSGRSTAPHLHFEVIDHLGNHRDPYQGVGSQDYTFWTQQRAEDGLPGGSCQFLEIRIGLILFHKHIISTSTH